MNRMIATGLLVRLGVCAFVAAHGREPASSGVASQSAQPPAPAAASQELLAAATLPPGKQQEVKFHPVAAPEGRQWVLTLKARLHTPTVAGYTSALRVAVNGIAIEADRLVNWERTEVGVNGRVMSPAGAGSFNVPYAPDFDSPNSHPYYALKSGPKLCRYELRIADFIRPGDNTLTIVNTVLPYLRCDLVLADVCLEARALQTIRGKRPAPTGPLPVVRPQTTLRTDYSLARQPDGSIELRVGGEIFRVESEFSTPQPAWVRGVNRYFDFQRHVDPRPEAIVVRDTFTNRTAENLPLMLRHRVLAGRNLKGVWVAGLAPAALENTASEPANPTSFGVTEKAAVGVLPLDDVFLVHATNFTTANSVGLADYQLVLRPHSRHMAEWAVVPVSRPDYYAFVNAARRLRNANFTLEGSFAFLRADPRTAIGKWTDRQFVDFLDFKSARFVCGGISWPTYQGRYPHGTAFQTIDWSEAKRQIARLRSLVPAVKHLYYFHCFIDVRDESPQAYRDARLLQPDGVQADYGEPFDRIFVPTEANTFGRDVAKNVGIILGPQPGGLGCDGVYWDEFEYSRYRYAYGDFTKHGQGLPWDGVSADIDPATMKISRLKSSVELISQPYRVALAKRILAQHALIANGQPHTRTMAQLHIPRFVETGSISNCALAQLFSPIALGDHLTERSERDAYRVMLRALDFGCVYYWYDDLTVVPTHPHLTRHMFPITPLELHEGYIIGRERIVTNRSGLFGWGDASELEVHVFDDEGREAPGFRAPKLVRDGAHFIELRLPEDYSAAIVRKSP